MLLLLLLLLLLYNCHPHQDAEHALDVVGRDDVAVAHGGEGDDGPVERHHVPRYTYIYIHIYLYIYIL